MSTTDYSGMFVYKDGHIDYVQTSEGRMKRAINGIYNAEYFIKDHLGNVRVVYSTSSGPSQVTDYYPFGLEIPVYGASDNKIKYNSKELQTDAKLDWYDYGARFYDPIICRWTCVDPMAEKYMGWNPYNYVGNNPIRFIDPNGEDGLDVAKGVGTVLGGTLLWVGGVTLITTGIGAGVGVASIMAGSGAIGCGVAQIVDGAANDGKNNVPSGLGELVAANADKAFGNENGELRKLGAVSDLAFSIATGGIPKTTDVISTLSAGSQINSVVSTAEVLYDDGTFYKKSSEQSQSEEKNDKKTNENGISESPMQPNVKPFNLFDIRLWDPSKGGFY